MVGAAVEQRRTSETFFQHREHFPIVIGHDVRRDSRNDFSHHRFTRSDLDDLSRFARQYRAPAAEFLQIFATLTRDPIGTYENLRNLHVRLYGCSGPSPGCIKVMRELILAAVNQRLQNIYRARFRSYPPGSNANHQQKIASLEATRHDVLAVLNSYDWCWLADWLDLRAIGETAESCVRRLANFAFSIQRVNFRFTYHCNVACRHCYNSSGPQLKAKRISLQTMLAIVAEMPEVGIGHLNLTGGEPFLYLDDVIALIAAGRAAGLAGISIYTNGFWASTDERAQRIIRRLADAGLMLGPDDHIKVSAGVYHQEFIAFDRVLILARNYYAGFGRRLIVDFELPPAAGALAEDVRNRISAAGLTDRVKLHFRHVAPLGRGKDIAEIPTYPIETPCNAINQIVFDPDGRVRPCCGLNNENHGIVISQSGQHRLKTLAKQMQNDPILQFLATNPMSEIFAYVGRAKRPHGYASDCHLCQEALGKLTNKEHLQAALFDQQNFYPFWFTLSAAQNRASFLSDPPTVEID